MEYVKNRTVDKAFIKIRQNKKSFFNQDYKNNNVNKDFCYKMYNDWIRKDSPVDIPILIMDNENLSKNKDIDIIPRLYSKYAQKNIKIPFIYHNLKNKYTTLRKYFRIILNKDIPNSYDFKNMLIEKKDFGKNIYLFESINIFLYTSFLLKQFSAVMNIIPHFYSPISDETKYYFYILFDYLRRDCIKVNRPLMKNEVIDLIKKLASLNNKVLTKSLFLNTFTFIEPDIFNWNISFELITENQLFFFSLNKEKKDKLEDKVDNTFKEEVVKKNKLNKNDEIVLQNNLINLVIDNLNNEVNLSGFNIKISIDKQ